VTPHALLIPFDFLLRNGLQFDLARDVPKRHLGGEISRCCEGEWCSGERVGGGVGGGVDGSAARRSPLSGVVVPATVCGALLKAMAMMWGL
jgi:hypothetical protein